MTNAQSFAERLAALLAAKNLTAHSAAKILGYEAAVIRHWLNGRNLPGYHSLLTLADFFGVTTDALMGRTPLPAHALEVTDAKVPAACVASARSGHRQNAARVDASGLSECLTAWATSHAGRG